MLIQWPLGGRNVGSALRRPYTVDRKLPARNSVATQAQNKTIVPNLHISDESAQSLFGPELILGHSLWQYQPPLSKKQINQQRKEYMRKVHNKSIVEVRISGKSGLTLATLQSISLHFRKSGSLVKVVGFVDREGRDEVISLIEGCCDCQCVHRISGTAGFYREVGLEWPQRTLYQPPGLADEIRPSRQLNMRIHTYERPLPTQYAMHVGHKTVQLQVVDTAERTHLTTKERRVADKQKLVKDLWYKKMRGHIDPLKRPEKREVEPFDRRYKCRWSPPKKPKRTVIMYQG